MKSSSGFGGNNLNLSTFSEVVLEECHLVVGHSSVLGFTSGADSGSGGVDDGLSGVSNMGSGGVDDGLSGVSNVSSGGVDDGLSGMSDVGSGGVNNDNFLCLSGWGDNVSDMMSIS